MSVKIAGCGARTAVGLTAASTAAAVRAAISGFREHSMLVDQVGDPFQLAWDRIMPDDWRVGQRLSTMLVASIEEAVTTLPPAEAKRPIPLVVGLPEPRPGIPSDLESQLTRALDGMALEFESIVFLPRGHAAGLIALDQARARLAQPNTPFCLAAAVDSYVDPETLEWLDLEGRVTNSANRNGFIPGEAAAACLLTNQVDVTTARGRLMPAAVAHEPCTRASKKVCTGLGLTEAVRRATAGLRLPAEKIDIIYCDINGERYRSEEFTFTTLRTQAAFRDVHLVTYPADCWGDVGAASGILHAILALASHERRYAVGPRALLWNSSESGERAAVVLDFSEKLS